MFTILSMSGKVLESGGDYMVMRRRASELAECRQRYVELRGEHRPTEYIYPA